MPWADSCCPFGAFFITCETSIIYLLVCLFTRRKNAAFTPQERRIYAVKTPQERCNNAVKNPQKRRNNTAKRKRTLFQVSAFSRWFTVVNV